MSQESGALNSLGEFFIQKLGSTLVRLRKTAFDESTWNCLLAFNGDIWLI